MKKLFQFLFLSLVFCVSVNFAYAQQYTITGKITSSVNGEPLNGAAVVLVPTTINATSDANGEFTLTKVPKGNYTLKVNHIGYEDYIIQIVVSSDMDFPIQMKSSGITTDVIEVNRAVDRQTPVAFTNIDSKLLSERRAGQDAPLLLKNVPGFYAYSSDGVGNGEARLLIRGFSQNYVQVLINGVPTNDPESNAVYWSNWGSVSSNSSSIQIQRGAGSSLYGSGSFGGSFNILTQNPSLVKGFRLNGTIGDPKNSLYGFSATSGLLGGKFAATLNIDRKIAEGNRYSGRYEGLNYYTSVGFYPSANQSFNLVLHGAPQKHGYSFSNSALFFKKFGMKANSAPFLPKSVVDQLPVNKTTGEANYGLNDNSRELVDDEFVNLSHNFFHKPQLELHFTNSFKDNSILKATLFYSTGRGGGSSITQSGYTFSTKKGSTFSGLGYTIDTVTNNLLGPDGYITDVNVATNTYLKNAVQRISYSLHDQVGFLASYQKDFNKNLRFTGGAEFRYWHANHPGHFTNLFSKDSSDAMTYATVDTAGKVTTFKRYIRQGDLDGPTGDVGFPSGWNLAGDKDPSYLTQYRSYLGETPQFTIYAQANYVFEKIKLNVMGSLQYAWYQYKLTENMPSENAISRQLTTAQVSQLALTQQGPDGSGKFYMRGSNNKWYEFDLVNATRTKGFIQPKIGFNWNATENFNVFGNFARVQRMVDLGAYYNYGRLNPDVEDEKSNQFELGFGWIDDIFQAKINGYYMIWDNKSASIRDVSKAGQPGYDRNGNRSELVGSSEHKGIEFEAGLIFDKWLPVKGFGVRTSFTFMDNKWSTVLDAVKTVNGVRNPFNTSALDPDGKSYTLYFDELEGTPVASGPQLMTSASLMYDNYGFFGSIDMNYFGKDYMLDGGTYLGTEAESMGLDSKGREMYKTSYTNELPTRFVFDATAGYNFVFEKLVKGTVSLQLFNIFDKEYFSSSDRYGVIPGMRRSFRANLSIGL